MRHAIVLCFDRLHLGYLGCYGNDWVETPQFDRLAVKSVVFDAHFGENFDPAAAGHAWWTGRYQFPLDDDQQRACRMLPDVLRDQGISTKLLIETGGEIETRVAPPFDDVLTVAGEDGMEIDEHDTPFAQLISRAVELLESTPVDAKSSLVWLKSRGVPNPWIPPKGFSDLYFDEFNLNEPRTDEHAEVQYARALYAAYVTVLDRWLGKLLTTLDQSPVLQDTLLIVTATAGEQIGEHGPLGVNEPVLLEELIHTPLLIRVPTEPQAGSRRAALVQTVDIALTLLDWFGIAPGTLTSEGFSLLPLIRGECDSIRDAARMGIGSHQIALRTANFYYTRTGKPSAGSGEFGHLFEKPHDRWDMVDVGRMQPHIVEELEARIRT